MAMSLNNLFCSFLLLGLVGGRRRRENSAPFFVVSILIKDEMDPFTDGRQNTSSQIFRLEVEKWKKRRSYRSDAPPFEHHASYHLITNGCLRKGTWIHNYLIVHTDKTTTDPPRQEGFINYHPSFLLVTCFWICFPAPNGNLLLLSLCSVLRLFQINPLIIWLSECINTLQEFGSEGHCFPSLRHNVANQELQHSALRVSEPSPLR